MKKLLFLAMGIGLLVALGACSDDSSTASATITGASGEPVELNGTWALPDGCRNDGQGGSESESWAISGTDVTISGSSFWEMEDCAGTANINYTASGSFTLGDEVDVSLGSKTVTATKTDTVLTSATATPTTADDAASMNKGSECGVSDWAAGVASDILDGCFDATNKSLTYVDDSVTPNRLYQGDESGVDTTKNYPTKLSSSYLERQ